MEALLAAILVIVLFKVGVKSLRLMLRVIDWIFAPLFRKF